MNNPQLGTRQFLSHAGALFKRNLVDSSIITESLQILLESKEAKTVKSSQAKPSPKKINGPSKSTTSKIEAKRTPGRPSKRTASPIKPVNGATSKRAKCSEDSSMSNGRKQNGVGKRRGRPSSGKQ